jgi:hypothetical protein
MGERGAIKTPNYGGLVNLGKKIELSAEKVQEKGGGNEEEIKKSLNHSQPIWSGQTVPLNGLGHEMNIFYESLKVC